MLNVTRKSIVFLLLSCFLIVANAQDKTVNPSVFTEQAKLGAKAYEMDDFETAANIYRSISIDAEKKLGETHPFTLTIISNTAKAYAELGRLDDAIPLLEKILSIKKKNQGEKHKDTIETAIDLLLLYYENGNYVKSSAEGEKTLKLSIQNFGEDNKITSEVRHILANTYFKQNKLSAALELHERNYEIRTKNFGENNALIIQTMDELAPVYFSLHRYEDARKFYEKVYAHKLNTLGKKNKLTLGVMNNLSQVYVALGDYQEGLSLQKEVTNLTYELFGDSHQKTLTSMNNLAGIYDSLNQQKEAIELYEEIIRRSTKTLGESHPETLVSLNNLAISYSNLGKYQESLVINERVYSLRKKILGEYDSQTLTSIFNLSVDYYKLGRVNEALSLSKIYIKGAEFQRNQPDLTVENRQAIFLNYVEAIRFFSMLQGQYGNVLEGFRLAELGKARTLLESMAAKTASIYGGLEIYEKDKLETLEKRISNLRQTRALLRNSDETIKIDIEMNEANRNLNDLKVNLAKKYPKYSKINTIEIADPIFLYNKMPSNSVAINYIESNGSVSAYFKDSYLSLYFIRLGKIPDLEALINVLRKGYSHIDGFQASLKEEDKILLRLKDGSYKVQNKKLEIPTSAVIVENLYELAQYLSDKLLKPMESALNGKNIWIISPDGLLSHLPFEALPWGKSKQPVIASAEIQYTQSLSVFALGHSLKSQYSKLNDRKSLFAMGNPIYEKINISNNGKRTSISSVNLERINELRDLDNRWPNLPGTEKEIKSVESIFPDSSSIYLGSKATEKNLQELNSRGELKKYKYLLFSVHGYLSPYSPDLSSIVLGLNDRSPDTDGYVTASEWTSYELQSDLIVLSACDSGMGKIVLGEGVKGLSFSLFLAGNVNTVLTLWPIDDDASSEFIKSFFQRIKLGQRISLALAETKREFIKHKTFFEPRYWAPFILIGPG